MPGIELESATCKVNAQAAVLSLQPQIPLLETVMCMLHTFYINIHLYMPYVYKNKSFHINEVTLNMKKKRAGTID